MKEQTNKTPVASASRHTPEPWKAIRHQIDCDYKFTNGHKATLGILMPTASAFSELESATLEANAARIVSCVNAMAGMRPEAVKDVVSALELLLHGAEIAQKQGLNQPQVNGGVVLARAALAALKEGK